MCYERDLGGRPVAHLSAFSFTHHTVGAPAKPMPSGVGERSEKGP
jgi:hypothetical protein